MSENEARGGCRMCGNANARVYYRCANCGSVVCDKCLSPTRQCAVCASGGLMEPAERP